MAATKHGSDAVVMMNPRGDGDGAAKSRSVIRDSGFSLSGAMARAS